MIAYFDASALVKRYVPETGSDRVEDWWMAPYLATSQWTQVEILSALSRRCREGLLSTQHRNAAAAALSEDLRAFVVVAVDSIAITEADGLLARHPLRAGDAIQLASALVLRQRTGEPVAFLAFDDRLNAAADREGLVLKPG